jgi:hypothetical protein
VLDLRSRPRIRRSDQEGDAIRDWYPDYVETGSVYERLADAYLAKGDKAGRHRAARKIQPKWAGAIPRRSSSSRRSKKKPATEEKPPPRSIASTTFTRG